MTQREKRLSAVLLGILVVFGGGFLFHVFVYEPVTSIRAELDAAREELQEKKNERLGEEKKIQDILHVDPRLSQWAQISLPPHNPELKKASVPLEEQKRKHLANLRVAYEGYLSGLMTKAGFLRDSIKVEVRNASRGAAPAKGKEVPPYEQLTFGAVGQGRMDAVTLMMREFHRTPLLHHVRNVSLGLVAENKGGKKNPGLLEMNLTIDALLMKGAEDHPGLQPKALAATPRVLAYDPKQPASGGRNYLAMNRRNMFTGYEPTPAVARTDSTAPKVSAEDRKEVLRFVRLTSLIEDKDRNRWQAWLYDLAKGGPEKKLNTGVLNEFTITGKGDQPVIEAKVVKIDEEFMVFVSDGKYYRMRVGDFLYPAIDSPLKKSDLKAMGITPEEPEKKK